MPSTTLDDVTVVITTIPPRESLFARAVESVENQSSQPAETIIAVDHERQGAAKNRNSGLFAVKTKWTAFLDDDDFFYPEHLAHLYALAEETDSDLVYPWFDVLGGSDPLAVTVNGQLVSPLGVPFGESEKNYIMNHGNFIPVTTLVRTELAQSVGGFSKHPLEDRADCEDWGFLVDLLKADAKFTHLPERTWAWCHWGGNTSGLATRW